MILNSPYITGSLTVTGNIVTSGSITLSGSVASSSFASNADKLDNLDSTSFVFTSSFNTYSSSMSTRVSNTESTGSSLTTASGSFSTRVTNLESTGSSLTTASGSFSTRISSIEGNYATTGSNVFMGAQTVCANITSTGTIIAQTINVQQVTSSIVYSSGSNIFGNLSSDVQQMTGSLRITGSLNTIGNACVTSICSPSIVGGTISGTTIYGSTVICGASICTTGNTCFGGMSIIAGCLGIGTASPTFKLMVAGTDNNNYMGSYNTTSGASLRMQSNQTINYIVSATNPLQFEVGAAIRMAITSGGNVGIGTTSPDVTGFGYTTLTIKGGTTAGYSGVLELQTTQTTTNDQNLGIMAFLDGTSRNAQISVRRESSTSTAHIDFFTNAGAGLVERMRITSGGNVGIGTTSPDSKLQVDVSSNTTTLYTDASYPLRLENTSTTNNSYVGMYFSSGNGIGATIQTIFPTPSTTFEGNLSFSTRDNTATLYERMRITSGGNVGIGTTSPTQLFHVLKNQNAATQILVSNTDITNTTSRANFFATNGSVTMRMDAIGASGYEGGYIGTGTNHKLYFWTNATERGAIDTNGNFGIGTSSPAYKFQSNGPNGDWSGYFKGSSSSGNSYGLFIDAGTTSADSPFMVRSADGLTTFLRILGNGNVGIGTTSPAQKLVVQGTVAAAGTVGYTLNNVTNGNQVLTSESAPRGVAGLTAVGTADSFAIKTDPLGRAFGTVGLVGAAYDANGGGRNVLGVYGYALHNAATSNNSENKPVAGLFLSELGSNAGAGAVYNGTMYGVYASANSSGATNSAGSIIGIYGVATGRTNDTTYGGYFAASGGSTNYGLIVSSGNVGIGTTSPNYLLHINSSTSISRIQLTNSSTGTASGDGFQVQADGVNAILSLPETGYMRFETSDIERMRITSCGLFKVQNTGVTYESSTAGVNEIGTCANDTNIVFRNVRGSLTGARAGVDVFYAFAQPNSADASFYEAADSTDGSTRTLRFKVASNGTVYARCTSITLISSDCKLKTDIVDYDKGLAEVISMKPRYYKYKDNLCEIHSGFIAQEINEALPGSMIESYRDQCGDPVMTYQVDWYPLLVNAIKQQQCQICTQASTITQLKTCLGLT